MKKITEIINLWRNWHPTIEYVSPSIVSAYYWDVYRLKKSKMPLFPEGEINDVLAVFSGSKQAAIMSESFLQNKLLLNASIVVAKNNNISYSFIEDKNTHVFAINENIRKYIEMALKEENRAKLGIGLGYPRESILPFLKSVDEEIKKYGGKEHTSEFNEDYIIKKYKIAPQFKIDKDWFE